MSPNDDEDASGKPTSSSRPRPNRPRSTAQRVKDLPETEPETESGDKVLQTRPKPGPRPANARRSATADNVPRATPSTSSLPSGSTQSKSDSSTRRASNGNGSNGNGSNGDASPQRASNGNGSNGPGSNGNASNGPGSNGNASNGDARRERGSNGALANGHRSRSGGVPPVTEPVPMQSASGITTALAPAPPAPLVVGPQRSDPGLMPAPTARAPERVAKAAPLPALLDEDANLTGPIAFDRLFDTGPDPSGPVGFAPRAPRQRSLQFTQTGRRGRPRIRRVTRVVRHVDPWSVFKVALCFSLVLYGVCLTAGVLLWNVAYTTGTIDNVQRFFESFGWDTFRFKGGELFHNAWIAGLFASLGLTGLVVLTATLFNLITDLVGGIRVTVLEEEVVERSPVVRGPLLRRRTRAMTAIRGDARTDEGYPDDGDSLDSPLHFG